MSDQLLTLGKELLSMGQKIIDSSGSSSKDDDEKKKPEVKEGKVLDMPNKALIVASLKRKIGE